MDINEKITNVAAVCSIILSFSLVFFFPPVDTNRGDRVRFIFADLCYFETETGERLKYIDANKQPGNVIVQVRGIKFFEWTMEFIVVGVLCAGMWLVWTRFGRKGDT